MLRTYLPSRWSRDPGVWTHARNRFPRHYRKTGLANEHWVFALVTHSQSVSHFTLYLNKARPLLLLAPDMTMEEEEASWNL